MPTTSYGGFNTDPYLKNPDEVKAKQAQYYGIGICGLAIVAIIIGAKFAGRPHHDGPPQPPRIPAITSYISLSSPTGIYKIQAPSTWKYSNHSNTDSDSNIEVFQNSSGSDDDDSGQPAAPRAQATVESPEQMLADAHQNSEDLCTQLFGQVTDGTPSEITTDLGPAYVSQFTSDVDPTQHRFWATRGYRETLLTPARRVVVICACPDIDWSTLQPGFWKIVNSISHM
jgi:hypothetical protein